MVAFPEVAEIPTAADRRMIIDNLKHVFIYKFFSSGIFRSRLDQGGTMKKIILFILTFMLACASVALANVEATGEGPSKDAAVSAALRKAVEQSLGTHINSQTLVVDSAMVDDRIYSHSKGYVKRYDVIRTVPTADGFAVTISAEIDNMLLRDDLNSLTILRKNAIVGNPRILVVFSTRQKNLRGRPFIDEIYNGIVESLTDRQFRVVDKSAADQFARQLADTLDIDVILNRAATYGLSYQAEYTLYYDVSGLIIETSEERSVQVSIKSQLIDNTRGTVITSKRIDQGAPAEANIDMALQNAGREGGYKVVSPIIGSLQQHWMDIQNNGAIYTIVIEGVDDAVQISRFSEMFARFPLANGTRELESGGGKTTFESTYRGKREQLDRDVLRAAAELGWTLKKVRAEGARSTWKRI
jgi:ABC-type uncharacterized transport system auxiliary subunit